MSDDLKTEVLITAREDGVEAAVTNVKRTLKSMGDAAQQAGTQASNGLGKIGSEGDNAARKIEASTRNMIANVQRQIAATEAGGTANRQYLESIAKMRGLDGNALRPWLDQLDAAKIKAEATAKAQMDLDRQLGKMGQTAGQTRMALQQLPMQFQDIVVSLQAGQAPMTVMLQQGSQLAGSFGGVAAAAKAMGSYVLGLVNPFTLAAAAVAVLGVAYYQGSKEVDEYRKALVLSGNQAGTSIDQLTLMARQMAAVSGTQSAAAAGLAEMAQRSKVGADNLKEYTTVALQWEKATGEGVSKVAAKFADLAKDPLQASLKLNEEMNHLTASVYDQIKALEKQGKTTEAAALAQKAYANAMDSSKSEILQNLGYMERAFKAVGNTASWAWDKIAGIGRPTTPMTEAQAHLDKLQQQLNEKLTTPLGVDNEAMRASREKGIESLKKQIEAAKGFLGAMTSVDALTASMQANNKDYVDSMEAFDKVADQFASKETKRKQALTQAQNTYNAAVEAAKKGLAGSPELDAELADLQTKYNKSVAGINKQYEENGSGSSGVSQVASIRARIEAEEELIRRLELHGTNAQKVSEADQLVAKLQYDVNKATDARTKKLKEAELAEAKQLQAVQNKRIEMERDQKVQAEAEATYRKYIDTLGKTADSIEDQALKQDSANASFGKSKVAIAELAMEQAKLAAASAKDVGPWTQEQVDKLTKIAAAHEHYVQSLKEESYIHASRKHDEELRDAQALLELQQYSASLFGVEEVARNKLMAQRKNEIKLAKELKEIEKTKYSDNEVQNWIRQEEEKKKVRLKYETETQTELGQIQDQFVQQQAQKFDDIFRQGFADMVNNGSDGLKAFGKSLKTTVLTSVADALYQAFARKYVIEVAASITGMLGGNSSAVSSLLGGSTGGGSSVAGLASNASSLWNAYNNAASMYTISAQYAAGTMSAANAGGTLFANSVGGGLDALLATNGAYGTAAGSSMSMGALSGAGIGAAIVMAAAYLGGMFKSEKQVGAGLTGELGGDVYGYQLMREGGSLFSGPSYKYIIAEQELAKARAEIEELKKNPELETDGNLTYRMKYLRERVEMLEGKYGSSVDGSQGPIDTLQKTYSAMRETVASQAESLGLDGEAVRQMKTVLGLDEIHPDTGGTGLELFGLSEEEAAAKVQAAMEKANEDLARSVLGSMQEVTREITRTYAEIIPVHDEDGNVYENRIWHDVTETVTSMEWVMSEYVREGETAVAALNRISGSLVGVNQVFEMLGADLLAASIASGDWASKLIEAMGGIDNLNTVAVGYYDRYYSDDEKQARQISAANSGMEGLGLDLRVEDDNAQQKYRRLVDGAIEAKDEALLASLLKFAEQFGLGVDAVVSAAQNHLAEMEAVKQTALSAAGLSVDSMVSGFIQQINEGRGAQAGSWLADSIAVGFEQAIYGQAVGIIMNSIIDGVVTPVITAAMAGSSVSAAVSGAAIDTMVANATTAASALNALLGDAAFNAAISDVLDVVRDLGNSIGSSIPKMSTYKSATSSLTSGYTYAGNAAESAAEKAKKLADQWSSTIDSMTEEMKRLRGELLGGSDDQGAAYYESLYAIKTAQARAGDQDAANELPSIIQALEELAKGTAGTKAEVLLMQSAWLASLGDTRDYLAGKYGVDIGNEKSSVLGATTAVSLIKDGANTSVVKALQGGSDTPALIAEIKALRAEVAALRADNRSGIEATAPAIQQINKTLRKFDIDGMPATRKEGRVTA